MDNPTVFVTPGVENWPKREIGQWVAPMKDRSDDSSNYERPVYHGATSRSSLSGRSVTNSNFIRVKSVESVLRRIRLF